MTSYHRNMEAKEPLLWAEVDPGTQKVPRHEAFWHVVGRAHGDQPPRARDRRSGA